MGFETSPEQAEVSRVHFICLYPIRRLITGSGGHFRFVDVKAKQMVETCTHLTGLLVKSKLIPIDSFSEGMRAMGYEPVAPSKDLTYAFRKVSSGSPPVQTNVVWSESGIFVISTLLPRT